ncbi:hypothetical protein PBY51_022349 [Eleginops maclovinus]|uniref:Uncharacterized protein n=1 Tax=Eleginops maclovinus TaxID=56733 RepID=A0AAN7XJN8_ELEMC|nr:hypothetical protein PBY51_022349 [Eleginops maclovinus]
MCSLCRSAATIHVIKISPMQFILLGFQVQSSKCDPFFHNALEAERLLRVDGPPNQSMCWGSGQGTAAV